MRVIISRSPEDSSTDGTSHHTAFDEEQKNSGKDIPCNFYYKTY